MIKPDEIEGYLLEPIQMDRLRSIMHWLYSDKPLSGDQRRDLANAMYGILNGASEISI